MSRNPTIALDEETIGRMKHPGLNWSEVARNAIKDHVKRREIADPYE